MELLLIMVIPALVIYSVGKLVDYINPKFKGDDCYTKHLLPRKRFFVKFGGTSSIVNK